MEMQKLLLILSCIFFFGCEGQIAQQPSNLHILAHGDRIMRSKHGVSRLRHLYLS